MRVSRSGRAPSAMAAMSGSDCRSSASNAPVGEAASRIPTPSARRCAQPRNRPSFRLVNIAATNLALLYPASRSRWRAVSTVARRSTGQSSAPIRARWSRGVRVARIPQPQPQPQPRHSASDWVLCVIGGRSKPHAVGELEKCIPENAVSEDLDVLWAPDVATLESRASAGTAWAHIIADATVLAVEQGMRPGRAGRRARAVPTPPRRRTTLCAPRPTIHPWRGGCHHNQSESARDQAPRRESAREGNPGIWWWVAGAGHSVPSGCSQGGTSPSETTDSARFLARPATVTNHRAAAVAVHSGRG